MRQVVSVRYSQAVGGMQGERVGYVRRASLQTDECSLEAGRLAHATSARGAAHAQIARTDTTAPSARPLQRDAYLLTFTYS